MPDAEHSLLEVAEKSERHKKSIAKWHYDWETPAGRIPASSLNEYFLYIPVFSYFYWF